MAAQLQRDYPKEYPKELRWSIRAKSVQEAWIANERPMLMVVLAAVGFVLLMVCVNSLQASTITLDAHEVASGRLAPPPITSVKLTDVPVVLYEAGPNRALGKTVVIP